LKLVFLLALLWGGSFPLLKLSVETIPPLTVVAGRAFIGGVVLLVFLGARAPQLWRMVTTTRDLWVQSFFNCILPWMLTAWASTVIASGLVTILNSLSPIFIFLMTWAITRHESAPPRKFVGVALGMAGVVVIVGVDALRGLGTHTVAELACVVGSLAYGIAAILGRRYDDVSPLFPAAGTVLIATFVMIPVAIVFDWTGPVLPQPSMTSIVALVASGIFSTAFGFIVYFRLLGTIGAIGTSAQAYLRIGIGVAIGVIFLGETLRPEAWIGLLLVVAAVIAMVKPSPR
jgi:drug/metabolite transporter (DMT)-like permease